MDVILDFDGTLAEGCGCPWQWLLALARSHGYVGNEKEAHRALEGCTDFDAATRLGIEERPEEFTRRLLQENRRKLRDAWWHPHLPHVLRKLSDRYALHVLSNRDQQSLDEGLDRLGCRALFRSCVGSLPGTPGKPSTALYRRLRSTAPGSSAETVYVGDKQIDREFARECGIGFVAACWYRDVLRGDRSSCTSFDELPEYLRGCYRQREFNAELTRG